MTERHIADHIEIVNSNGDLTLRIDGEEFPYAITEDDGITVRLGPSNLPTVTITLVAWRVTTEDHVGPFTKKREVSQVA